MPSYGKGQTMKGGGKKKGAMVKDAPGDKNSAHNTPLVRKEGKM